MAMLNMENQQMQRQSTRKMVRDSELAIANAETGANVTMWNSFDGNTNLVTEVTGGQETRCR
jgi:hypothetical protein